MVKKEKNKIISSRPQPKPSAPLANRTSRKPPLSLANSLSPKQASPLANNSPPMPSVPLANHDDLPKFAKDMEESSKKISKSIVSSFKLFVILCIAFIFLGLIISTFFSSYLPKPAISSILEEGPLLKNSGLKIYEGESFRYVLKTNSSSSEIFLGAGLRSECPGIYLSDLTRYGGGAPIIENNGVCLGKDGVERDKKGQKLGNNMSFSNLTWPYFQPWMLALDENFTWNANLSMFIEPYNLSQTQQIKWKVTGTKKYLGRDSYEVIVQGGDTIGNSAIDLGFGLNSPITLIIDEERRILLFMQEGDLNISLISAPFLGN